MHDITLKSSGFQKEDYFLQKDICAPFASTVYYQISDNYGIRKKGDLPDEAHKTLNDGKKYIIGKIYKKSKQGFYEIHFAYTQLPVMRFGQSILLYLIEE